MVVVLNELILLHSFNLGVPPYPNAVVLVYRSILFHSMNDWDDFVKAICFITNHKTNFNVSVAECSFYLCSKWEWLIILNVLLFEVFDFFLCLFNGIFKGGDFSSSSILFIMLDLI
jgi:hypothetical protein